MSLIVTEEERQWIHNLAKTNKSSVPIMLITLLDLLSKHLGIELPKDRLKRRVFYTQGENKYTSKQEFMARIDRELGL